MYIFYTSLAEVSIEGQSFVPNIVQKQLGTIGDYSKTGDVLLANPSAWGNLGSEDNVLYRELKNKEAAEILFAAFDVDSNGFCKHDMILEILYRDDFKAKNNDQYTAIDRPVILSRIDFAYTKQYFEIGNLKNEGDGRWKLGRIFIERTPRQMIRAIDSSFHFRIKSNYPRSLDLPISFIKLRSVFHEEFLLLREMDRANRGLERVEFDTNIVSGISQPEQKSDFVVYPVNCLELVFPQSPVKESELNKPLKCFELPGQSEAVSFVIHALKDINEVSIECSNILGTDTNITSDNVDVCHVVYNDQRWAWGIDKKYGRCPDYLSIRNPVVNIKAHNNCQFWLTINVPESAREDVYNGIVTIKAGQESLQKISISLQVLPIKLEKSDVYHMIYHSPFCIDKSKVENIKDAAVALRDMRSHGVIPISAPEARIIKTVNGVDVKLDEFEHELREFRKVFNDTDRIFISLANHQEVYVLLNGPEPRFQQAFPKFELYYGRILKKYADLAKKYGLEPYFSFQDEVFGFPERRRVAYLCSSIAKKNGLKTWSTHWVYADKQLPLTELEIKSGTNYLRPLKEVLDVLADGICRINKETVKEMDNSNCTLAYYTTGIADSIRPLYNRFLNGWYPFRINAQYVLSYAYADAQVDPYDDMDGRANFIEVGQIDFILFYPTWDGQMLPTLSYEALREGIEDSCLISKLRRLIVKAKKDGLEKKVYEKSEDFYNGVLNCMSVDFEKDYRGKHKAEPIDPMEVKMLKDLNNGNRGSYEIFDNLRWELCRHILDIEKAINNVGGN